jgi:hypothetical protein
MTASTPLLISSGSCPWPFLGQFIHPPVQVSDPLYERVPDLLHPKSVVGALSESALKDEGICHYPKRQRGHRHLVLHPRRQRRRGVDRALDLSRHDDGQASEESRHRPLAQRIGPVHQCFLVHSYLMIYPHETKPLQIIRILHATRGVQTMPGTTVAKAITATQSRLRRHTSPYRR